MSEDIVARMRQIYCCVGATFARSELRDGWQEIIRLRTRVAALEEELESWRGGDAVSRIEYDTLRARVVELEEGLRPFAEYEWKVRDDEADSCLVLWDRRLDGSEVVVRNGDIRRARRLLGLEVEP